MTEQINKQCPICGEYISVNDNVCKFCGEEFISEDKTEEAEISTEQHSENEPSESGAENIEETESDNSQSSDEPNNEEGEISSKPELSKLAIALSVFVVGVVAVIAILYTVHKGIDVSIAPSQKSDKGSITHNILSSRNSENIDRARELYNDGHMDEAAEMFQKEIDSSGNPIAYYYMGEIYKEQGFIKIALTNYKKALDNKKDFFEAQKAIAYVYTQTGDYDKALEYAQKAVKQKPKDVELLKTLANIYSYLDEEDKMIETYKQIANLDKKDYDSNYYLANYYYGQEEYKQAIPYFSNLVNSQYNTSQAYSLATCYARVEYYTKAMEVLDLIIKKDPYEYRTATYAKSRLSDMKDYYNATHKKNTRSVGNNSDENYDDEAEDALF